MNLTSNTIIKADGTIAPFEEPAANAQLDAYQKAVGGYIEPVNIPGHNELIALVNEEGLLKQLPVNATASGLLHTYITGDCLIIPRAKL